MMLDEIVKKLYSGQGSKPPFLKYLSREGYPYII